MITLMGHQQSGVSFLRENDRALLADEAGLGKTLQALVAAEPFLKGRSLLWLTPTSVKESTKDEAEKWGLYSDKLAVVGYEYEFLHYFDQLIKRKWGVIVADEAQMLRNLTAQRTKNFLKLIKNRDSKIWFLTGDPIWKGAQDLFVMLSIMEPGKWGKYKDFCEKYCKQKTNQWKPGGIEYHGYKKEHVGEIKDAMNRLMLRRFKKEVDIGMPEKIFTKVPLDVGSGNFDKFTNDGIVRAVSKAVEQGSDLNLEPEVVETIQELGLKKVDHVIRYIKDTRLIDYPLVVFAHNRLVLYDIAEKLRDTGKKVQTIIGGMDKTIRQQHIRDFQNGKLDILVCSILAAGVGLNMFRSSRCVNAQLPWTWAALDQAANRLHRIGQLNCVNVYNCIAKGTFEERQYHMIEDRKDMTSEIVGIR